MQFDHTYARLPERFYAQIAPTPVTAPALLRVNEPLAGLLGISPEWLASAEGVSVVAGNTLPTGAEPIALAYSGHQFGHWAGQLGDGRAILLGELIGRDGIRYDLQLKGSGRTPFSRGGDGRAALGPVLREFLVSEAMHALGVPTTRVLSAVTTGELVYRESGALPGAVLARVARAHLRVGTFEHFASRDDVEGLRLLADYAIRRLAPELESRTDRSVAFFEHVLARTAALVAKWQSVGFIHGVMNTDNLSIAGETIDYGPCAFMDTYHPHTVFSSIDRQGRYAYANQPHAAHWNLMRLAQSLLPVIDDDEDRAAERLQSVLDTFPTRFTRDLDDLMRAKLGLAGEEEGDQRLIGALLERMATAKLDFTNTFRALCDGVVPEGLEPWGVEWRARRARSGRSDDAMRAVNPVYIGRNHRVEAALAAAHDGDLTLFDELLAVVRAPFSPRPEYAAYTRPPEPHEVVRATFCGT